MDARHARTLSHRQIRNQVESCPATEARLTSEFRRNPYGRALLLATMARFRTNRREQEQLLTAAAALLRQASRQPCASDRNSKTDSCSSQCGISRGPFGWRAHRQQKGSEHDFVPSSAGTFLLWNVSSAPNLGRLAIELILPLLAHVIQEASNHPCSLHTLKSGSVPDEPGFQHRFIKSGLARV